MIRYMIAAQTTHLPSGLNCPDHNLPHPALNNVTSAPLCMSKIRAIWSHATVRTRRPATFYVILGSFSCHVCSSIQIE